MKKASRIIAMMLVLVMALALCACGGSAPAQSGSSAPAAAPAADDGVAKTNRKIGTNQLMLGAYALDIITTAARQVTDICGDELIVANDEMNVEKIIADVENFIASDVDAICWWGLRETNFAVGPAKAEAAGIPIAFPDKIPPEGELTDNVRNMKCFAGGVGCEDYSAGINLGNYALELGCTKALIGGAEVGDTTHEPRIKGFIETFEAGGGKVLEGGIYRGGSGADANTAIDNLIAAHPEADCFFGSGGDYALAAVSVCATLGRDDIKVLAVDIGPDLLPYLEDGSLAAGCGAHWVSGMYAMIMLENYLDGKPMLDADGKVGMPRNTPLMVVPANMAKLYERFWIDEFPYEESEIKQLLYRYNPDVTLEDLQKVIASYSIEDRLIAKYNAGKVTAEELAAVGINVG
jgi:ribose transport system substrate-binding protein